MLNLKVNSIKETADIAKIIAGLIEKNLIICLEGDLGAGKTLFTKCFCKALNIKEVVTSPTFNLMNVYEGDSFIKRVYHFDLYRLENEDDLYEIGFYEYTDVDDENEVVLIEWPDKFMECMPEDYLYIKIERVENIDSGTVNKDENKAQRNIMVDVHGNRYKDLYKELEKSCRF